LVLAKGMQMAVAGTEGVVVTRHGLILLYV
jgi:hypothetical protein